MALGQVRGTAARARRRGRWCEADTAGAAQLVAEWNSPEDAAIASALAAEIYGLDMLRGERRGRGAQHHALLRHGAAPRARRPPTRRDLMTTFVFRVRNVPAALYKALGGFATNGVNMTKLESYMVGGQFTATQFLCDVDGHPEQPALRRALEELSFFSREVRVLGVYPAAAVPAAASGGVGAGG